MFFTLIFIIAMCFMNFYSYKFFVSKIAFLKNHIFSVRIFFILVCILEVLFIVQLRFVFFNSSFYIFSATFLAFSWFLFTISILYHLGSTVLNKQKFSSSRREFIKICFDITFVILFISFFLKGLFSAIMTPKIKEKNIKIKNLKKDIKIALITDIHIGTFLQKEFLTGIVNDINKTKPDIVAISGDLVDMKADEIGDFLDPLKDIKSKYGVFYVPGNHEYYHGVDAILAKIETLGVNVLRNDCIELDDINVCGVYDVSGYRFDYLKPDLKQTLSGVNDDKPVVLLAHQPKFVEYMDKDVDLVLSGHTHAGQIFPFGLLVLLQQPYLYGLYQHNDKMQIYVSSGAGFWGPPVRILAQSEIAILNLYGDNNA
ncbi:metallophosphatase [Campylobacter pinnipediorum subsp. pinnipediorum]|uniref:Metallophosphatase n=1 Tax=Campylobacter pinnipediorum subsp. pinnipediorum TaxID=1660067 RepID=A0AAX0LA66_9BACT|nr:metallophosphoesterase [Campylobacter pinnipediorum]OPA77304.1 metallophosphatase [Campylobacter pinnipediorum subsp. pinnipediorum]